MRPKVLKIDPQKIDLELIKQAAEVISNRGLVAFPTETVYGLGANALEAKAVAGIFEAKSRPLDDPLIVHIAAREDLYELASCVPGAAEKLIDRFWPGPLTIVLKKKSIIPDIVTTGLETVAIRMPYNPVAQKFIATSGVPIAAPSANLFGRPSPTNANHVINDLEGKIDLVLDGGHADIGVESTVVEFVRDKIIVLRPGGTTVEDLRSIVGEVEVFTETGHWQRSPGRYPQHYSPKAKVKLVSDDPDQVERVLALARQEQKGGRRVGIMATGEHEVSYREFDVKVLGPREDARLCASRLFHILREFDEDEVDVIVAEAIGEQGLGLAVMNRLRKSAGPDFHIF